MQIYKVINNINKKIYVGKDTKSRPTYYGSSKLIRLAIQKYGIENFSKEILEECVDNLILCEREIYWINKLNATDKNIGYNIQQGGEGIHKGAKLSSYHKKQISNGLKKRWKDDEFRENRIKSLCTYTPERKEKIRNFFKGRPLSESGKQALRDRKLNVEKHNARSKKISESHFKKSVDFWKTQDIIKFPTELYNLIQYKYFDRLDDIEIQKLTSFCKNNKF